MTVHCLHSLLFRLKDMEKYLWICCDWWPAEGPRYVLTAEQLFTKSLHFLYPFLCHS